MPNVAQPDGLYANLAKRLVDVVVAIALILVLSPVMGCTWIAVRLVLGRPVLYRDERSGLNGRPIHVVKFRSMAEQAVPPGRQLSDAERLSGFGRFLRRTSLDELPQLFNVLAGDMSLVGPRPLPLRYRDRYSPRQASRLLVRPGLTGWAQIHGRNALDWPARLELDARYVEMTGRWYAPLADFWIIMATVFHIGWQAATGRGVTAPGAATMQEFLP